MNKLVIIGDSGHAKVIKELISDAYEIAAVVDDKYDYHLVDDCIYAPTSYLRTIIADLNAKVIIAIGSNAVRKKITESFQLSSEDFVTLISPHAVVSPSAVIGHGTVIMPGAVINADAEIGSNVIINTGSIIEHDCKVEDYSHISPNSTLTGGVIIREGVHIGAAAVVNPLCTVGQWSTIGSGASVIRDIPDFVTAVGVPGVIKK